tara:strand:+ start:401 stop:1048 length:648 start_codon:yes stop_codon:yes gene_type:complete
MANKSNLKSIRYLMGMVTIALTACSTSIWVEADFPQPLVDRLPVRMGLILDDELLDYVHYEELPRQAAYTIQIGEANELMLGQLFQSMFLNVEEFYEFPNIQPEMEDIDGILWPVLDRFEFDVPVGQRDEFVEVWMQYLIRLYDPDGQLVTEWTVSGYGKAELLNREQALNRATVVAMREVGATISTKFSDQPDVQDWLQDRQISTVLSVGGIPQ